jgi:hypothetical protein
MKNIVRFITISVMSFTFVLNENLFSSMLHNEINNQVVFQGNADLLQVDYFSGLDDFLNNEQNVSETNDLLTNLLEVNSDLLIIRHLPTLEKSQKLAAHLHQYYAEIFNVNILGDSEEAAGEFSGILIASKIAISSPEKIHFGNNANSSFVEFTLFNATMPCAEFFVLNDQISPHDDSIKLKQLNKVSEQSALILSQGYQIPCVLCMKPKCAPKHSEETENSAVGRFIGEEGIISEPMQRDSNQNVCVILKNTAVSSNIDLSFGYQAISWIDRPTQKNDFSCFSAIRLEKTHRSQPPFMKHVKEPKSNSFFYMNHQAKDDRPEREAKISGSGDSNGNSRADASITFGRDFDDGSRFEISGRASVDQKADGTTTTNVGGEASYKW